MNISDEIVYVKSLNRFIVKFPDLFIKSIDLLNTFGKRFVFTLLNNAKLIPDFDVLLTDEP